jgi:hypothetical protein
MKTTQSKGGTLNLGRAIGYGWPRLNQATTRTSTHWAPLISRSTTRFYETQTIPTANLRRPPTDQEPGLKVYDAIISPIRLKTYGPNFINPNLILFVTWKSNGHKPLLCPAVDPQINRHAVLFFLSMMSRSPHYAPRRSPTPATTEVRQQTTFLQFEIPYGKRKWDRTEVTGSHLNQWRRRCPDRNTAQASDVRWRTPIATMVDLFAPGHTDFQETPWIPQTHRGAQNAVWGRAPRCRHSLTAPSLRCHGGGLAHGFWVQERWSDPDRAAAVDLWREDATTTTQRYRRTSLSSARRIDWEGDNSNAPGSTRKRVR